jgi:hypothetical protein
MMLEEVLPRGEKGEPGAPGLAGPAGLTVNTFNTQPGSTSPTVLEEVLPRGEKGEPGAPESRTSRTSRPHGEYLYLARKY